MNITNDQLLDHIDAEISRIEKDIRKPGWNEWTLIGAISGLLWLLIKPESTTFNSANTLFWFLLLWAGALLIRFLGMLTGIGSTELSRRYIARAFSTTSLFAANRNETILDILMAAILLTGFFTLRSAISTFTLTASILYFGLMAAGGFLFLVSTLFKWPVVVSAFESPRGAIRLADLSPEKWAS